MIIVGGHQINPDHVSAIHVIPAKGWRLGWEVEIQMVSGYSFTYFGYTNLVDAESSRDNLARYLDAYVKGSK